MQSRSICKKVAGIACAVIVPLVSFSANSQSNYPEKPLNYVVTVPPGGAADFAGRTIAEALSKQVGQTVVIENKAGASGTDRKSVV